MAQKAEPTLERQIVSRLAEIALQLTELSAEQKVLQSMLEKVRRQHIPNVEVTRKNSHQRVLVETSVHRSLEGGNVKSVRSLFLDAQLMVPNLKGSTFRSYLHRLAQRGLIQQLGSKGNWMSVPAKPDRPELP